MTGKNTPNSYIHTRIDKFYISSQLTPFVTQTDLLPYSFSDHDLIPLPFDLNIQPCGDGYCLVNNNLLEDDIFTTEIESFWTNWLTKKNKFNTPLKWWNTAKNKFKNIAVKRITQLSKYQRHECRQLEKKILHLQQSLANGDNSISEQKTNCNTTISTKWLLLLLGRKFNTLRKERKEQDIFFLLKTNKKQNKLLKY